MITLLVINKVFAIYVGPGGYAAIGQFHNAVQMVTAITGTAIQNSVTKYTAEHSHNPELQHKLWKTAGTMSMIFSIVTGCILFLFSNEVSVLLLKDEAYSNIVKWFSVSLVFFIFNTLVLSILNGKKEVKSYVSANILGSLISLLITTVLSVSLGLYGALFSLAVYQSISFFATLSIIIRLKWFKLSYLIGVLDVTISKNIFGYVLMAMATGICSPLSSIFVREYIASSVGWEQAGLWEALMRLSGAYLMIVTTTLSIYFLPKFSELKLYSEIKSELFNAYKIIIPLLVVMFSFIYILRDIIVILLFSEDFKPISELFAYQLFGDVLKVMSWLVAYLMIGKAMVKTFIFTEVLFSVTFCLLAVSFIDMIGFKGVIIAYCINYLFYWIIVSILVHSNLKENMNEINSY